MKPDFPSLFECLDSEACTSLDNNILNALGVSPDKLPFLKLATTPTHITCPGCEEYCPNMPVTKGSEEAYVMCDKPAQYGKVFVDKEDIQHWRLDLPGLAKFLSDSLDIGNITEIFAGRLYDLGVYSGHALFLVKGIMWQDAQELCKRITKGKHIFITLSQPPASLESLSMWIVPLLMANNDIVSVSKPRRPKTNGSIS